MNIWIEIRQERHTLGNDDRDEWSYGKALWSPTTDKGGAKRYKLMKQPSKGDLVLHFYQAGGVRYFHAKSRVMRPCQISTEIPSNPGKWSWAKEFFRIDLGEFEQFDSPLNLSNFTDIHDITLRHEIVEDDPSNYPFQIKTYTDPKFTRDSQVTLKQGKYLSACSNKLLTLLEECSGIEASNQDSTRENQQLEYHEGKRKERETYFFARNPKLVREAKKLHKFKCQACEFEFKDKYGEFGKNYIECHHENVLSERPEKDWSKDVKTTIDDVKVLCANCHRMVHHKRPALKFVELIELLKSN